MLDPRTDTLYHAIDGQGAYKNGSPWQIKHTNGHLTYVTDRKLKDSSRATEIERLLTEQAEKLGLNAIQEIVGGGAVLNAIRVLEHGPACMIKLPKKEIGLSNIDPKAANAHW